MFSQSLAEGLPYILGGLCLVYLPLMLGHYLALNGIERQLMLASAGLSTLLFAALLWWVKSAAFTLNQAHLIGSIVMLTAAFNSLLHLGLSGDAKQATNLVLIMIGAGCFLLTLVWWALVNVIILLTWVAVSYFLVATPDWLHYGFMLFPSVCLSAAVLGFRRSSLMQNQRLALAGQEKIDQLEAAFGEIQTLESFLPICAWCKSVRSDDGFWEQVESYIGKKTSTTFTHGMCPSCANRHKP